MHISKDQAAPAEAAAGEVGLLRDLALAAAAAAASGTPLPEAVQATLAAWLGGGWQAAGPPDADQGFTQGYIAALETAARHCTAAAEARALGRRAGWNPWRRRRQREAEAALRSMAAGLRLMAGGLQSHGR